MVGAKHVRMLRCTVPSKVYSGGVVPVIYTGAPTTTTHAHAVLQTAH